VLVGLVDLSLVDLDTSLLTGLVFFALEQWLFL